MFYNLNLIRKLARESKWQMIYRRTKDMSGIRLFNNETDFTDVQTALLYWLEIYSVLNFDISMQRPYINEDVIKDDIRVDAYLSIRKEILDQETDTSSKKKKDSTNVSGHSVIFRKG